MVHNIFWATITFFQRFMTVLTTVYFVWLSLKIMTKLGFSVQIFVEETKKEGERNSKE